MALNAKQEKAIFKLNVATDKAAQALLKKYQDDLKAIYDQADKEYEKITGEKIGE